MTATEHGAENDLRDLGKAARQNKMEYTLERGYRAERQQPLQRLPWIDVSPEDGSLQVVMQGLGSRLYPGHYLELDFSQRRDFIPVRLDLDRINAMVSDHELAKKVTESISCMPVLQMLVPTPPLFLLLNACPLGTDPAQHRRQPPFISTGSLLLRYMMVKVMLQGNQDLTPERRLDAVNVYDRAREAIHLAVNERSFPEWMLRQGQRFYYQFGKPEIQTAQDDDERECLLQLAKLMASSTIATIRNLEHYIWSLLDKELDPTSRPTKDLECESQAVRFDDVPPAFAESCARALDADLSVFLTLRLRFVQKIYETPEYPVPERLELSRGHLPDYPLSIEALKYLAATVFIAYDYEQKQEAAKQPRTKLQAP